MEDVEYQYGFSSNLEQEVFPLGLNENIITNISRERGEPDWVLNFRLKAYEHWKTLKEPTWADLEYTKPDFQNISYFAGPSKKPKLNSLDEVDPKVLEVFEKLGIPIKEQEILTNVATDFVLDSMSIATTFKKKLNSLGIIFCSISEAIEKYPDTVSKYLGKLVSYKDNFYACLNAAVFSDGTFCYIPPGVKCPMEISTYFRINAQNTGQFERTLIIADKNSYVSYLEGCTAPERKENQLHAAVVELFALDNAEIKYSTVQNWYPGNKDGEGGIFNFVTKRGICQGVGAKISWTQVETGSAITWKYPSVVLKGDDSVGEFYSVSVTNNYQQADTGSKMIHIGINTKSNIISKSISSNHSTNTYRGIVQINKSAKNSFNYSVCDSILIGTSAKTNTFPKIICKNNTSITQHEASSGKITEDVLIYCQQRGLNEEQVVKLFVNGFVSEVFKKLPLEFGSEANKLLSMKMEGSVG